MAQILDQYGNPIATRDIAEPQTARLGHLINQYLDPALNGLSPARLAAALRDADQGNLLAQHRIFADMEDRDTHILGEMQKRKNALTGIDWDIVPPRNATAAEEKAAAWVKEVLQDNVDSFEDLVVAMMDAAGHGFSCVELEWKRDGSEWLPTYHPRPHEWFRLDPTRTELRLADASVEGMPLQPCGWVWHVPGKAKTGYGGRMGLYRPIVWPFIYKAYAIGDFAEFLETYGLPIIVGKYNQSASSEEKNSLLRAVTQLGHDARAIMPEGMLLDIQKVAGGGDSTPHMTMEDWADKSISKLILGGTLTSQADGKTSTNALGNVHNEVRHDILKADARQVASTLTRDLVYPLIAFNKGGVEGLRRCPRVVFDTGEAEDLSMFAEALPKLSTVMRIPANWAYGKLRIPEPQEGDEVLGQAAPPPKKGAVKVSLAALSATPAGHPFPDQEALDAALDAISPQEFAGIAAPMIQPLLDAVKSGESPEALMGRLAEMWPAMDQAALVAKLERLFFVADLVGRISAKAEVDGA